MSESIPTAQDFGSVQANDPEPASSPSQRPLIDSIHKLTPGELTKLKVALVYFHRHHHGYCCDACSPQGLSSEYHDLIFASGWTGRDEIEGFPAFPPIPKQQNALEIGYFDGTSAPMSDEGHPIASPVQAGAPAYISMEVEFEESYIVWSWKDATNSICTEANRIVFSPHIKNEVAAKVALVQHHDAMEISHSREHNKKALQWILRRYVATCQEFPPADGTSAPELDPGDFLCLVKPRLSVDVAMRYPELSDFFAN